MKIQMKWLIVTCALLGALWLAGCGKEDPPNPNPAPGPTYPNPSPSPTPAPTPGPGIPEGGQNCAGTGPAGGLLSQTPYVARLRSVYPHPFASGRLTLLLGFAQVYAFDTLIKDLTAAGSVELSEGSRTLKQCVASTSGQIHTQRMELWLKLQGTSSVPGKLFIGLGGTSDCLGFLFQGRIVGCVDVVIEQSLLSTRYRMIAE